MTSTGRTAVVRIFVGGEAITARAGDSIAAALIAAGRRTTRSTPARHEPRGYFCGMGICHDCLIIADGVSNVRACMTPVRDGMRVEVQRGLGHADGAR